MESDQLNNELISEWKRMGFDNEEDFIKFCSRWALFMSIGILLIIGVVVVAFVGLSNATEFLRN